MQLPSYMYTLFHRKTTVFTVFLYIPQCDEYQGADAVFRQVLNPPVKVGIIGAGCSPSTQNAALVSQFYNITQV